MNTGSNPVGVADSNTKQEAELEEQHGTDVQALAQRWPEGEKPKRQRKVGLCKRRGCKNPLAPGLTTCEACAPRRREDRRPSDGESAEVAKSPSQDVAATAPEAGKGTLAPASGARSEALKEVELQTMDGGWGRRAFVATVGVEGFTVAGGAYYMWAGEGASWRKVGCDVDPLKQTAGKNGMPELPAVPGPRTCKGIPIYQGPDEVCDALLGREVQGDRCTVCAEWMRAHGECDGCNGRLPGWQVTGKLCGDCRAVRQAAIREQAPVRECGSCGASERCASYREGALAPACPLWVPRFEPIPESAEQPNDKPTFEGFLVDAYRAFAESLWERMAEDAALDPVTVAACKQLRDDERVFSSIFLARGLR